jgi:hypothetical protein
MPLGLIRRLIDTHRQAEINRLVTRAARRVTRDFNHAIEDIPDAGCREHYRERLRLWQSIFWDTAGYRDSMHLTIDHLERKVAALEGQLRAAGIQPETDLPF